MRIISWNINGIRAACGHGFWQAFSGFDADIICLQEVKAEASEIPQDLFSPGAGYHLVVNPSQTPGRSGVAVFSKIAPSVVENHLNLPRFDDEGRILKLVYPGFTLFNFYLPHGGRDKKDLDYKLAVYDHLLKYLENSRENAILVGDFNIAHKEVDLARPKDNLNNIMFTPQERKRLDKLVSLGFVDTFRRFTPEGGYYTWLSYIQESREKGLGWRLDYAFVSKDLAPKVKSSSILPDPGCSDHVPIALDFLTE